MTAARLVAGCAAALLVLAGCTGSDEGGVDAHLLLVVPDNNIRVEGVECAGARPFRYIHRGTPYTLETPDGTVLEEGELPAGRAENADPSIEWGVERIPTVCVMELSLTGLPEHPRYQLRVEGGPPLPFDAALLDREEPLRLTAR